MNKRKFITFKILPIIVIIVVIIVMIPNIVGVIKQERKKAFINDTRYILKKIGLKMLKDELFDPTIINVETIENVLDVSNVNYESVTVTLITDKLHITIVGKEKWAGLTTCGTIDEIVLAENSVGCV